MAEKKIEPLIKLPPEARKRLEEMEGDLERADHSIEVMKELGMDTKVLEEKLDWAKRVKKILLREF